jgi:hypothetical protein
MPASMNFEISSVTAGITDPGYNATAASHSWAVAGGGDAGVGPIPGTETPTAAAAEWDELSG